MLWNLSIKMSFNKLCDRDGFLCFILFAHAATAVFCSRSNVLLLMAAAEISCS
jgi:hypothetical protein